MDGQNLLELAYQTQVSAVQAGVDFNERVESLRDELEKLRLERGRRLPVEESIINMLDQRIQELKDRIHHLEMAKKGYPERLSVEIFRWRYREGKNKGLPVFMVLPLGSAATFRIRGNSGLFGRDRDIVIEPTLPKIIASQFKDLGQRLVRQNFFQKHINDSATEITITATFAGAFPDATLEKIEAAKGNFSLFVIAQVDDWSVTESVRIDPIIVGMSNDKLYIVDKFDLEPLEQYAAEQFAWRED